MTYTLTLTDEQAEILGYALTRQMVSERKKADEAKPGDYRNGCRDRQRQIEAVRCLLDACPAT